LKDLNDRLRTLDKDVSDVLTSNKSFFNEEKAAADLKASQKDEREQIANKIAEAEKTIAIKIAEAQARIQILKDDYAKDTEKLQTRIDSLRKNNVADNSFGITDKVDTSEAVRWVILIIICVFDPLAVLLLIAANQSLLRRFPVNAPKPQEIVDLEKPDEEDVALKWNEMIDRAKEQAAKENAEKQLKEWQDKLEAFNKKVPQPDDKPVEIVQEQDDSTVPHIDLVGQKKTEDKEIVVDNMKDGFDPDEVMFDLQTEPAVDKVKQLEEFKKREQEEKAELERIAEEARQEEVTATVEEALKMNEAESVETPIKEERIKPDLTEVIEPESVVKNAKPLVMRTLKKEDTPPKLNLSNWQRAELLDNFHKEHGNFKDVKEYAQNEEQNDKTLWAKSKNTTSEMEYHERVDQRINDLITKIENKEIELTALSKEDQRVINEINQQKKNG
jgi:hypothetical protein